MKEFTSIESFRHVVASVKRHCAEQSKPLPTIEYVGTKKLHGTSGGVRITPNKVQPQKRTAIVDIGNDNAGFAAFCHNKDNHFRAIADYQKSNDITLFGEWCGGVIQKGVALNQLEKHFVIFSAYDAENDEYINIDQLTVFSEDQLKDFNAIGIWFINQIPKDNITIDFRWPENALEELNNLTLAVEEECPWGKFRGVSGIGEGIVWTPKDPELFKITGLWFKTKGGKHASKTGGKTNVAASPEKLESIKAVVEAVLPEWRLQQGISKLKEDNLPIEPKSTGEFLKWVSKDILKEEADIITSNGLDWKAIVPYVMREARSWYLKEVDNQAFNNEIQE